jgi:oligopeptide/dipeptide ABC transporter ATP-binding protein
LPPDAGKRFRIVKKRCPIVGRLEIISTDVSSNRRKSVKLIETQGLAKRFNLEAGFFGRYGKFVYALRDLSFHITQGETYGLVGESGCGKTTTARLLVRMYKKDSGTILYREQVDVGSLGSKALRGYREKVKYVFQDPARSLNPRLTVEDILLSGYRWSTQWPGKKVAREQAAAILEETGLSPDALARRPGDFSGGQRQRISIARGLLMGPELLICDEVVSALDVSIQGQILNLLGDIREKRGLSYLFIAHDLKVACYFCDRIGVMYRGELMEEAPAADLHSACAHPYTKLLFASVGGKVFQEGLGPVPGPGSAPGIGPSVGLGADACAFATRCPLADGQCRSERPDFREIRPGHRVRCCKV